MEIMINYCRPVWLESLHSIWLLHKILSKCIAKHLIRCYLGMKSIA